MRIVLMYSLIAAMTFFSLLLIPVYVPFDASAMQKRSKGRSIVVKKVQSVVKQVLGQ
jgi:hypothetical protein